MDEILVEEYRGNLLENTHRGHVCGISDSEGVQYVVGNTDHITYLRSAAKPIQVIPMLKKEFDIRFHLSAEEQAIMAGSHRGEPFHLQALQSILDKIGVSEEDLVCLPTYPLNEEAKDERILNHQPKRRLYHNCSGKHLGVLALCKGMGYSIKDYWEPTHPAQTEILEVLSMLSGYPQDKINVSIDGCGFPVFALPLRYIAQAYLNLACPDLIADSEIRMAVEKITSVMNEHPQMIAGTDFICSSLLQDPNIVAKGGAKGVYGLGLKDERQAFALKVMDGSEEEWPLIIASILEQIDYKNKETIDRLYQLSPPEIKNDNKKVVGLTKAVFQLEQRGSGEWKMER